jgi:hypothetical protein
MLGDFEYVRVSPVGIADSSCQTHHETPSPARQAADPVAARASQMSEDCFGPARGAGVACDRGGWIFARQRASQKSSEHPMATARPSGRSATSIRPIDPDAPTIRVADLMPRAAAACQTAPSPGGALVEAAARPVARVDHGASDVARLPRRPFTFRRRTASAAWRHAQQALEVALRYTGCRQGTPPVWPATAGPRRS